MPKALFITYYWPPAGGGGVQRIAKFCKYLPDFGWETVVLTVEGGHHAAEDASLVADVAGVRSVHRVPAWEPHALYRKLLGKPKGKAAKKPSRVSAGGGWKGLLGEWVRLNLFIPDSRIFWLRPAIRRGLELIASEKPDLIFSSSPPYTPHLIAQTLSRKSGLPWVVDYRDPWVENHAYNTVPRLPWVLAMNRWLEKRVLRAATSVTAANPRLADIARGKLPPEERGKVVSIPNGYDTDDLAGEAAPASDRFVVSYYGTVYPNGFPDALFAEFGRLVAEDAAFARDALFRVTGSVPAAVAERMRAAVPAANLLLRAYLPHAEMLRELFSPQALVLVINDFPHNEATVPGKVYEYLPTGNPILGIGPVPGDAADMLAHSPRARMVGPADAAAVGSFYQTAYADWRAGTLHAGRTPYPEFDRRELCRALAGNLDEALAQAPVRRFGLVFPSAMS